MQELTSVVPNGTHVRHRAWARAAARAAVPIGLAIGAACSDVATHPARTATTVTSPATGVSAKSVQMPAGLLMIVRDAEERLSGTIKHAGSRSRVRSTLTDLDAMIVAGDVDGARRALALARTELMNQGKRNPVTAEAADRDAIMLSLDEAERMLAKPTTAVQQPTAR